MIKRKRKIIRIGKNLIPVIGLFSLIWFLIRVIPKPSRATYPCQRAAFPLATSFILWLMGTFASFVFFRQAKLIWKNAQIKASFYLIASVLLFGYVYFEVPGLNSSANTIVTLKSTPILKGTTNIVSPVSTVAIVQSAKVNASNINSADILALVREAVNLCGGFASLIKDGDTVVIKPNLVGKMYKDNIQVPDEANGMTTDYRVVQAVVTLVREVNPTGKIYVMENSANGLTRVNMDSLAYNKITGITALYYIDEESGKWRDSNSVKLKKVKLGSKGLYSHVNYTYYLNKLYYDADFLISVPVLKNHGSAGITGGIKNVGIGATPSNIYGKDSGTTNYLTRSLIDHSGSNNMRLDWWIHDYFLCRPVDFVITDGIQGCQKGATCFSTDIMNMRCILAGKDPVAVDAIQGYIMSHDPKKVPYLVLLNNDGKGCVDSKYIRVVGNKRVDQVKKDFATYPSSRGLDSKFSDFVAPTAVLNSIYKFNDTLYINLTVGSDAIKAEISIDGEMQNSYAISTYNDIRLDIKNNIIDSVVHIYVYDQYLNCNVLKTTNIPTASVFLESNFEKVIVYPNPFKNYLTIKIDSRIDNSVNLIVRSAMGKVIKSINVNSDKFNTIDLKELSSGNYILEFHIKDQVFTRKIVKE